MVGGIVVPASKVALTSSDRMQIKKCFFMVSLFYLFIFWFCYLSAANLSFALYNGQKIAIVFSIIAILKCVPCMGSAHLASIRKMSNVQINF